MTEYQLTQCIWLFLVGATCVQAAVWKWRSRSFVVQRPHLRAGYARLIRSWLLWGNLPWLVLGVGAMLGGLSFRDVPNLKAGNPFVMAFYATVVLMWVLGVRWLYFRGGAEELAEHPGLFETSSPLAIKLWTGVSLLGGVAALVALYLRST